MGTKPPSAMREGPGLWPVQVLCAGRPCCALHDIPLIAGTVIFSFASWSKNSQIMWSIGNIEASSKVIEMFWFLNSFVSFNFLTIGRLLTKKGFQTAASLKKIWLSRWEAVPVKAVWRSVLCPLPWLRVVLSEFPMSRTHFKGFCSGSIWPEMHKDLFWLIKKIFLLLFKCQPTFYIKLKILGPGGALNGGHFNLFLLGFFRM